MLCKFYAADNSVLSGTSDVWNHAYRTSGFLSSTFDAWSDCIFLSQCQLNK